MSVVLAVNAIDSHVFSNVDISEDVYLEPDADWCSYSFNLRCKPNGLGK
jgi:hypothetical protein